MINIKSYIYVFICRLLPWKLYYKLEYYRIYKRKGNIKNPIRLTEKLFWLTRYNEIYNKNLIRTIYDKNDVRNYVKEKGLGDILIPQLGVYKDINDINFDTLPNEFILKSSQSSGENIICVDKMTFNKDEAINKISKWLERDKKKTGMFKYYFTDKETIVCEKLLKDKNGIIPDDIKIFCCNGNPVFIHCNIDSVDEKMNKKKVFYRECFDINWTFLPFDISKCIRKDTELAQTKKPDNLQEMLNIARLLSKDFVFVRVDLYNVEGKIFFGELTPIPGMAGGFEPDYYDYFYGEKLKLPDVNLF